jgi:hypothetical protein
MPCIERQKPPIIKKPANYPKHSALFDARQNTLAGTVNFTTAPATNGAESSLNLDLRKTA